MAKKIKEKSEKEIEEEAKEEAEAEQGDGFNEDIEAD